MQQRGFTLIELIVVIVILGILAVTAAPRFIDVQADAKAATVQSMEGALKSASQMVYAKAAVKNQAGTSGSITLNSQTITLSNGYPVGTSTEPQVSELVDLTDWNYTATATVGADSFGISPSSVTPDYTDHTKGCYVIYTLAAGGAEPTITSYTGGC